MEASLMPQPRQSPSGMVYFAAAVFLLAAAVSTVDGLIALLDPQVLAPHRLLLFGHHRLWGVLDLVVAGIQALVGVAILQRRRGGQIAGLIIAWLAFLEQFAYLAHDRTRGVVLMVINAVIIYALTVHSDEFV